VKPGNVESTDDAEGGGHDHRDKQYGSPTSTAKPAPTRCSARDTRAARTGFFLMDILRHTGRAQLSSFIEARRPTAPWTTPSGSSRPTPSRTPVADRQRDDFYGAEGQQLVTDVTNFVAGSTLCRRRAQPTAALLALRVRKRWARCRSPWTRPPDVLCQRPLIGGIFGKGGGQRAEVAQSSCRHSRSVRASGGRRAVERLPLQERPRGADHCVATVFPNERPAPSRSGVWRFPSGLRDHPAPVAPSATPRRARRWPSRAAASCQRGVLGGQQKRVVSASAT